MRTLLVALATVWFAVAPVAAQPALERVVPASPQPASFIFDGGPVLDAAARARLDSAIARVQRETGGDIAVAIVPDLGGRAPQEVAVAIYRAWGVGRVDSIGSARRDLGALLLIVPKELAPDDRGECFLLTGRGAEGTLLDSDAGRICRDAVIPQLRERAYEPAIAAAVAAIDGEFRATTAGLDAPRAVGAAAREPRGGDRRALSGVALAGGSVISIAGLALFVARYRRRRPRPCPNGCGPMTRLGEREDDARLSSGQRMEERVESVDYDVWACTRAGCDGLAVIPYARLWSGREACPKCRFKTVASNTHTVTEATRTSTGIDEITLRCAHCHWHDVTRRVTPVLPAPGSSSGGGSSGGGGGGGGSSFGGSGSTSGSGGGSSY